MPSKLDRFFAFCLERENIRLRREAGKKAPWTKDKILRTFSFCNVNREHDRVTKWIDANIRKPYAKHPLLWFNLVVARLFNWPDTLKEIGFIDGQLELVSVLGACKRQKERTGKVFTGAYIVSTNGVKMDKVKYVYDKILWPIWEERRSCPSVEGRASCQEWAEWLMGFNGLAGFMANQIVTDMKYTPILPRDITPDWMRFVIAGPGTKRGLNRLEDIHVAKSWPRRAAEDKLRRIRSKIFLHYEKNVVVDHFWDLNNLSNCFCEWDKYERVRLGEGRPRALFKPHS